MRFPLILAALALAAPASAAAQDLGALQHRLFELQAQVDLARQREVAQHNEFIALDARLRTEQSAREVAAARISPPVPTLPYAMARPVDPPATSPAFPSIPDSRLAASNAAVAQAAENRR